MSTQHKPLISLIAGFTCLSIVFYPNSAHAMHIAEGFLPIQWAFFWWLAVIPFLTIGFRNLSQMTTHHPELKLLLALAGAFGFVLSALKLPSVTGSCSHPTGIGLGTILFNPPVMTILGSLVLLFQAVLLAHGGLTTLGANIFSMAIVGSWVAYGVYILALKMGQEKIGIFLAAALSNLATYLVTSLQLSIAFPTVEGGIMGAMIKFSSIFAITQIPLAIMEGFLTLLVWNWLTTYASKELEILTAVKNEQLT